MSIKRSKCRIVTVAFLLIVGILSSTKTYSFSGMWEDREWPNSNPATNGCAKDAIVLGENQIFSKWKSPIGKIRLLFSPKCQVAWALTINESKLPQGKYDPYIVTMSASVKVPTMVCQHTWLSYGGAMEREWSPNCPVTKGKITAHGSIITHQKLYTYPYLDTVDNSAEVEVDTSVLNSLILACPLSVTENTSSAGICSVNAYYTDITSKYRTSKTVTPSWSSNNSGLTISSNGNISTKDMLRDTDVTVTATYNERGKTVQNSAIIRVKDVLGPVLSDSTGMDPQGTTCEKDATTVASKKGLYGTLELRWSNICKTNWARILSNLTSYKTEVNIERSSDKRNYSYSNKGNIWTKMVYAPNNIRVCASGKINGESFSSICR